MENKMYFGSRKTARAFTVIKPGTGKVRINNFLLESIQNDQQRSIISTPLQLLGDDRYKVDLAVKVKGGGTSGQAYASAISISKALVSYFKSDELKKRLLDYDRHLLVGDKRQKESKKPGGPGARRKEQKSYR